MTSRLPLLLLTALVVAGCAGGPPERGGTDDAPVPRAEVARLRLELAEARRHSERLAQEAARLRADVENAEQALVALESGLRGAHSRADAVSALADARIVVERAERQAPWTGAATGHAREKLAEAEHHIEAERFGSALFFTARARRIAEEVLARATALQADPATRYVSVDRATVRAAPSAEAAVALVLSQGTPVRAGDKDGEWVQIVTPDNKGGWIRSSLLEAQP